MIFHLSQMKGELLHFGIILCYIIRREKMELSHKELNFCRSGDQSCTTPEQEFTCAVITIIELKYERSLILG